MRAMGISDAEISAAFADFEAEDPIEHFEVWPECWRAVQIFLDLGTQWIRTYLPGVMVWECLPLERVLPLLRELEPKRKHRLQLIEDLQTMERIALQALNDQR
ncbi:DUF1799 domain-containing protein [Chitinimonas taiwanensis]|uniref:DUF1799 domain-containing protein n=1 Tax=Chitinimonas taiwanensis TaxID=240412 RepID=UPI0035B276F4